MATNERVTVTVPAELVPRIDRLERNRSGFIAEAVERGLTRRRQEMLLESVRNPHPEATELAGGDLGDWTSDLPDDEGLVDVSAGTPGSRHGQAHRLVGCTPNIQSGGPRAGLGRFVAWLRE